MYNEEVKLWFLDGKSDTTGESAKRLFAKTEPYEVKLGRDCSTWISSEIVDFYKMISTRSIKYLRVINNMLNQYTTFCLLNNMLPDHQNHYDEINCDVLRQCVNKNADDITCLNKDELLNNIRSLKNASDKFIMLGLFEGICGKATLELCNAKLSDIEGNTMKLSSGRTVEISDELKEYAIQASEETIYYALGEKQRYVQLNTDSKYIIKNKCNSQYEYGESSRKLHNRIRNILEYMGYPDIVTAKVIIQNGLDAYLRKEADQLGMTPVEFITNKKLRNKACKKFNCTLYRLDDFMKKFNY